MTVLEKGIREDPIAKKIPLIEQIQLLLAAPSVLLAVYVSTSRKHRAFPKAGG